MRDETVVPDRYELTNKGMRLDTASLPNLHSLLNFDERTDERIVIDLATIEIHRLYNSDVLPEFDVDDSDGAKLRLVHEGCYPLDQAGALKNGHGDAHPQRAEPIRNCSLWISSRDELHGKSFISRPGASHTQ